MHPEESQKATPAKKAVKKIRTASLVISLARGWQQWASDHNTKQAQEPPGWMPNVEEPPAEPRKERLLSKWPVSTKTDQEKSKEKSSGKEAVAKRDIERDSSESDEPLRKLNIKSKEVTKTIVSKVYERGNDISLLSDRYEKDNGSPEICRCKEESSNFDKILGDKMSPTRRRKCSNLVTELTKGWKQMEQEDKVPELELHKCRSDSLDTEDSGYGGEAEGRLQQVDADHIMRIKRPMPSLASRFTEELSSKAHRKYSPVNALKGRWQQWADQHVITQKLNPFSEEFDYQLAQSTRLHKGDKGYGRPKEGTKTAERARRAESHIHREIRDMCFIIATMARLRHDGKIQVTFGELFDRYVHISDKVVGILMRARKHGLVDFEGEMLWQGRDDHVIITLLK
ncbi:actin-binding Rho-activating protein [Chelonoidis abingdonii]|uniref:actin-binding Rho-activating protein n=1 Tax=Chelonoidis abingdonii TaxID=106734 RepID=UPI0013F21519|nr:actin-binding Rho-activating protein [Chelonoidis abingdonii]